MLQTSESNEKNLRIEQVRMYQDSGTVNRTARGYTRGVATQVLSADDSTYLRQMTSRPAS